MVVQALLALTKRIVRLPSAPEEGELLHESGDEEMTPSIASDDDRDAQPSGEDASQLAVGDC